MGDLTDRMNDKMDYNLAHYPGPGGDAPAKVAPGFNAREREREIASLTSEVLRLRCALADIELLAGTLAEAQVMATKALAPKSST